MDFEDTPKLTINSEQELTPELAQEIFLAEGTPSQIFKNPSYSYNWRHIKKVYQHGRWLRKTMLQAMQGNYMISEAEYDAEGNEITPAVYFTPTTALAFRNFIQGIYEDKAEEMNELVLLDIEAVATQLMNGMTWTEWKASYGW